MLLVQMVHLAECTYLVSHTSRLAEFFCLSTD
jgi:hypothetical protein